MDRKPIQGLVSVKCGDNMDTALVKAAVSQQCAAQRPGAYQHSIVYIPVSQVDFHIFDQTAYPEAGAGPPRNAAHEGQLLANLDFVQSQVFGHCGSGHIFCLLPLKLL